MQDATVALGILIAVLAFPVLLESGLRLYRWRRAPLRLRLFYASFLLSDEAVQAITEIRQRVERAAARSFDELFELYAAASGKSRADIEAVFGFPMPLRRLNRAKLVLRNHLRWHVGLVPIPGQRLRTATITGIGTRSTGAADSSAALASSTVKRVMIVGGSVAYGSWATSDDATIAGRLQEHLNQPGRNRGHRWEVVNRAFPAATSFQELLVLLQHDHGATPPDYVVAITGHNDVDQQFGYAEANVSPTAQGYTSSLERRTLWKEPARVMARRLVLLAALKRAVIAYREWPGPHQGHPGSRTRAVRRDSDGPDIYPLW